MLTYNIPLIFNVWPKIDINIYQKYTLNYAYLGQTYVKIDYLIYGFSSLYKWISTKIFFVTLIVSKRFEIRINKQDTAEVELNEFQLIPAKHENMPW